MTAIGESDEPVKAMVERLNKLEAERAALAEKLRLIEAEGNIITLHPAAIDKFASSIEAMHNGLSQAADPAAVARYRAAFRNVFERFLVHPTPKRHPYEVTPYARLSAIMGIDLFPKLRTPEEMLREQGLAMPVAATVTMPT
jgi:site-specific DNA recombinase